jgi:hypothetical protein
VIFVSRISYDPLLGFSGAPTMIQRNYTEEQMLLAFESRHLPNPGVDCPPFAVAPRQKKSGIFRTGNK